jgi:uncharacterized GH25 family protein
MRMTKDRTLIIMITIAVVLALLYTVFSMLDRNHRSGLKQTVLEEAGYTFEVTMEQTPAKILKPNALQVSIRDADGLPVKNAEIDFELIMPHMFCGKFEGKASLAAPGKYIGDAIPLMAGSWNANVSIKLDGQMLHVKHPFEAIR